WTLQLGLCRDRLIHKFEKNHWNGIQN
ncbi:hypothetical protein MIMGU_mgv1a0191222mg, partial [Erythranthe guttata]